MSRFDRRDPGEDPDYCDGLGRVEPLWPTEVLCAYCDHSMARPPVMSSHPMCPNCRDRQLGIALESKAGAA